MRKLKKKTQQGNLLSMLTVASEGGHKASPMSDFSAICFLYAKQLASALGDRPLGLILSSLRVQDQLTSTMCFLSVLHRSDRLSSRGHENRGLEPKEGLRHLRGGRPRRRPQSLQLEHVHLQRHGSPVHEDGDKGCPVVPGRSQFWMGADKILLPTPRNVRSVEVSVGVEV